MKADTALKLAFVGCCLTSLGAIGMITRYQMFRSKQEFRGL